MLCSIAFAICCTLVLGARSQKGSAQLAGSASGVMASAKVEGSSVTVKTTRGEAVVPQNPECIAVYDFGMLDTLSKLGMPTSMSADKNSLPYLDAYSKQIKPAGTLFESDYEALNAYKPQLVIIGSRTVRAFDQLSRITPTIEMTADAVHLEGGAEGRIDALVQIFGKQTEAGKLKAEIGASFEAARAAILGKGKGLAILINGGKTSASGTGSRLGGQPHQDIGVSTADSFIKEKGNYGQPAMFEYVKKTNPDWLFVLDRSVAIDEEGKAVKDVLNNPLVAETTVWKKEQVVHLSSETYLAAGDVQELLNASKQVAEALNATK